jgi:cobalt-zinc-cadmium resistance protein CzcA
VNEIEEKISRQIKLPAGYYITYGGQFENLEAASARLSIAVPVALGLILLLLYFTFGSIKQSLLIFTAIPMAAIGGILALLLRGMPFSISAGVGFIALFGVAVLNGIVLITGFNGLRKENSSDSLDEIVLKGTKVRLRPVLMTATVASLGFLPMAVSTAAGAEVQKPLATVVIGGLITSTILTLVVLPVLYTYFEGWKPRVPKVAAALILLVSLMAFTPPARAQEPYKKLTMEAAVEIAIRNNLSVKSASLEIERQQALKGASGDIGKTGLDFQYGQLNSTRRDNNITISQSIPYPGVLKNRGRLADARIEVAKAGLAVNRNDLIYQVRNAYNQLSYYYALETLYQQQDSIYGSFRKAAALRYQTGESNLLESATAETQRNEVHHQLEKNQADIRALTAELQRLLNTQEVIVLASRDFTAERYLADSAALASPLLAQQRRQVEMADKSIRLERSMAAPDFTVGYFNQSIIGIQNAGGQEVYYDGGKRFQGVQAGIAIPLFYKPYASRIRAAKLEREIAQSQLDLLQTNLQGTYRQAYQEMLKNIRSVDYYEKSALPNAALILKQAQLSFQNGEVGYVEYLQALRTSAELRFNYLQAVHQYNQSVYKIKYLAGL